MLCMSKPRSTWRSTLRAAAARPGAGPRQPAGGGYRLLCVLHCCHCLEILIRKSAVTLSFHLLQLWGLPKSTQTKQ